MANDLGYYNPIFYAQEALIWLSKALGLASRVHVGYDAERRTFELGETVNIKRPATLVAQSAPGSMQDVVTEKVSMTLDQWKEVRFGLSDKELAYTSSQIIDDHIMPAAYALADDVDQALAALYKDIPWVSNIAGSTMAVADVTTAWQTLFDNQAPMANEALLHFMVGGKEWNELMQLSAFSQWQGAGPAGAATQQTAQLGRKFGFGFFANQNRPTHTPGVAADSAGTLTGAHSKGATSIVVAAVTASGTVKTGDSLVIAGNTQRYAITADATADGSGNVTLSIFPALVQNYSNGAVVTIDVEGTKVKQNLAFHRDAFGLAMARLPDYGEFANRLGMQVASVQDPKTGLAVRAKVYGDGTNSKVGVVLDVLYGVKCFNPNLAVRVRET